MSWTLTRARRPQDRHRVQLRHAGELATATWAGDRWELQVHSTALRDLAMHHGWALQAPVAPLSPPAADAAPEAPAAAEQPLSSATAPAVQPAELAAQAQALVASTVDEIEAALCLPRWRTDAALQAVLDAEGAGASRKGVRRAVARVRRQLLGG